MAKLTRESLITRVFSDPKNFPYGFSRSGDFTIIESKTLSQYGCLIAALVDGHIEPSNAEERDLLEATFGNKEPETLCEKVWVKYQKRINRLKPANIYGSGLAPIPSSSDDEDSADIDEDSDVGIEIDD